MEGLCITELFDRQLFKQRPQFLGVLDSGSVFDTAGDIDKFGVELFANCADIFGGDSTGKPKRDVSRFFAKQVFGNGLSGAAGNAFDFRVQQDAGFTVGAEGRNLFEVGGFAYAGSAVMRIVGVGRRRNAVKLDCVENTLAGEPDGGLPFGGIWISNDADEERRFPP